MTDNSMMEVRVTAPAETLESAVLIAVEAYTRQHMWLLERSRPRKCRQPRQHLQQITLKFLLRQPHLMEDREDEETAVAMPLIISQEKRRPRFYLYQDQSNYLAPVYEKGDHLYYTDYHKACDKAVAVATEKQKDIVIIDEQDEEQFRAHHPD